MMDDRQVLTRDEVLDMVENATGKRYSEQTFSTVWIGKHGWLKQCVVGDHYKHLYSQADVEEFIQSYCIWSDGDVSLPDVAKIVSEQVGYKVSRSYVDIIILKLGVETFYTLCRPDRLAGVALHQDGVALIITEIERRKVRLSVVSVQDVQSLLARFGRLSDCHSKTGIDLGLLSKYRSGKRPMSCRSYDKIAIYLDGE